MMSGLTLRMSSTLMRSLARASGRKLVRKTSLRLISSSSISLAAGTSKARPTLRLPRLGPSKIGEKLLPLLIASTPRTVVSPRCPSPFSACSTLITSAPQSARTAPAAGTNVNWATSRMRTPCIGCSISCPFVAVLWLRTPQQQRAAGRAAPCRHHRGAGACYLAACRLAAQLQHRLPDVPEAMQASGRQLPPVRVHREPAAERDAAALVNEVARLPCPAEPERLKPGHRVEGETVVQERDVDVLRPQLCPAPQVAGRSFGLRLVR